MKIMPVGLDNVILMSDEAKKRAFETARHGGGGVNSQEEQHINPEKSETREHKPRKWRYGEQEFEALMRALDNAVSILIWQLSFSIRICFTSMTVYILISMIGLPNWIHLPPTSDQE